MKNWSEQITLSKVKGIDPRSLYKISRLNQCYNISKINVVIDDKDPDSGQIIIQQIFKDSKTHDNEYVHLDFNNKKEFNYLARQIYYSSPRVKNFILKEVAEGNEDILDSEIPQKLRGIAQSQEKMGQEHLDKKIVNDAAMVIAKAGVLKAVKFTENRTDRERIGKNYPRIVFVFKDKDDNTFQKVYPNGPMREKIIKDFLGAIGENVRAKYFESFNLKSDAGFEANVEQLINKLSTKKYYFEELEKKNNYRRL